MALGATRANVAHMVLRQRSILIGAGLGVGLLLAFPGERLIRSFLYQGHPPDGLTYAAVLLALPIIGLIAALVPARKAASIQPMQALRED
jgi:ABC-type antimicrobial peptide transport system permease subunit